MKLRQLEFAIAIARTSSFSEAAEHCHATQPTLSSALAQLEQELGGKLFLRTTRKVETTPFGRHMLPFLEAVLIARKEAEAAAEAFLNPSRKLLRIGLSPLVDMRMLSMITEPFRRQSPDTELFFKECLLDDLSGRIDSGAIDLIVLPRDVVPEALDRTDFYSDDARYLPVNGIAEQAGQPLRVADIPNDPIIMTGGGCGLNRTLEVLFAEEGAAPPSYPGYAISYPVIQEWTWLGLGAAVLPQAKLGEGAVGSVPLLRRNGTPATFDFCWAWRREARELDHVAAFLDFARAMGPRLVAGRDRPKVV